ncbi:hypothetical protein RUM44_012443 [Polyplax serrata]|uniref:Uncharacterized protein n=1 Tax=Polyplax serrata TaxID=468196 RepID=A0ABR1BF41_POLSC
MDVLIGFDGERDKHTEKTHRNYILKIGLALIAAQNAANFVVGRILRFVPVALARQNPCAKYPNEDPGSPEPCRDVHPARTSLSPDLFLTPSTVQKGKKQTKIRRRKEEKNKTKPGESDGVSVETGESVKGSNRFASKGETSAKTQAFRVPALYPRLPPPPPVVGSGRHSPEGTAILFFWGRNFYSFSERMGNNSRFPVSDSTSGERKKSLLRASWSERGFFFPGDSCRSLSLKKFPAF